jgi:hypothetical protein
VGAVVNPGGWFGKPLWLIQVAIANALNPWVCIEADNEADAIDTLADSTEWGHLINVDRADIDEDTTTAGNDGHPVDLTRCHIQRAPDNTRYVVEWEPNRESVSQTFAGACALIEREAREAERLMGTEFGEDILTYILDNQ